LEKEIQLSHGREKGPGFPDPFPFQQRLPLLLVLLAAHILRARILLLALVLLARLTALLALLLAGLLTGFRLVLPLLLLAGLARRLMTRRLARLAALVIRHTQSPPGWFSQPEG